MEDHRRYLIERQKADSYRLFAACFHPPTKSFLDKKDIFTTLNNTLKLLCSEAAEHAWEMNKAMLRSSVEELQDEHARLFAELFKTIEPPCDTEFLEGVSSTMDKTVWEFKMFYEDTGFEYRKDKKKPPDYIAFQLEFFSYLSAKIAETILDGNETAEAYYRNIQRDFYSRFLGKWIVNFLKLARENANHDLYRSLAKCVESYISSERNNTGWQ